MVWLDSSTVCQAGFARRPSTSGVASALVEGAPPSSGVKLKRSQPTYRLYRPPSPREDSGVQLAMPPKQANKPRVGAEAAAAREPRLGAEAAEGGSTGTGAHAKLMALLEEVTWDTKKALMQQVYIVIDKRVANSFSQVAERMDTMDARATRIESSVEALIACNTE